MKTQLPLAIQNFHIGVAKQTRHTRSGNTTCSKVINYIKNGVLQ